MSKRYGTVEQRFWAQVSPEPNCGCWLWMGPYDEGGYGRFRINGPKRRTHRLAYEMHFGEIPTGLVVRHRCDNPTCVNPEHLELGSHRDNKLDSVERDRHLRGERAANAKLTHNDVRAIRAAAGTHREIGRRFGISHNVVGRIRRGVDWRHVN